MFDLLLVLYSPNLTMAPNARFVISGKSIFEIPGAKEQPSTLAEMIELHMLQPRRGVAIVAEFRLTRLIL
ncbi:hypothetical protein M8C21_022995, partial [Ambrosia artemisiifolia]